MTLPSLDAFWGSHFLKAYSTGGLHDLYEAVRKELDLDSANVREHPDFKAWAKLIEAELTSREEPFEPIVFP